MFLTLQFIALRIGLFHSFYSIILVKGIKEALVGKVVLTLPFFTRQECTQTFSALTVCKSKGMPFLILESFSSNSTFDYQKKITDFDGGATITMAKAILVQRRSHSISKGE